MRVAGYLLVAALAWAGAGCAGKTGGDGTARRDANLITYDEVTETHFTNAYELINALRPNWLQVRSQSIGGRSAGLPVIYVDGSRMGTVEFLRQIPAGQVQTAQFLRAPEATSRYGSNHTGGAILIVSRLR